MSSDTVHYPGFPSDAILAPLRAIQIRNGLVDKKELAYRSHEFRGTIRNALINVFRDGIREANEARILSQKGAFVPGVASAIIRSLETIVGPISEGRGDILAAIYREIRPIANDRTITNQDGRFALCLTRHCEYEVRPKWDRESRLLPINMPAA